MLSLYYLFIYFKEKVKTSSRSHRCQPCSAGVKTCCLLCWQQFTSNRPGYKPLKNSTLPLHGGTCHSLVFKHSGCTPHISQLSEIFASVTSLPILSHPIPSKHTFSTRQKSRVKPPFLFFSFLLLLTSVNTLRYRLRFHYYIFSHKTVASSRPQRGTCFHLCQLGTAGAPGRAPRSCTKTQKRPGAADSSTGLWSDPHLGGHFQGASHCLLCPAWNKEPP